MRKIILSLVGLLVLGLVLYVLTMNAFESLDSFMKGALEYGM